MDDSRIVECEQHQPISPGDENRVKASTGNLTPLPAWILSRAGTDGYAPRRCSSSAKRGFGCAWGSTAWTSLTASARGVPRVAP